jgi:hypothetical protein
MKYEQDQFKPKFMAMLRSAHLIEPNSDNFAIWRHCIHLGLQDEPFLEELYETCRDRQLREGLWPQFYSIWLTSITASESNPTMQVFAWHRRMLRDGLAYGDVDWRRLCYAMCISREPSKLLYGMHSLLRLDGLSPHFYLPVLDYLLSERRFEEAHQAHLYFFQHGDKPHSSEACNPLLDFHIQHSSSSTVQSMIQQLESLKQPLAPSTKRLIARFYAVEQDYDQLAANKDDDEVWASALLALAKLGKPLEPVLKRMQETGCQLGPSSLQACLSASKDLESAKKLIAHMLQRGYQVSARGYATLVRFIAKHGDATKASKIVKACVERDSRIADVEPVSQADTDFLYRNLILGLVEGRHYLTLELVHHDLVANAHATSDTWNLLVRSRIVNSHMDDALAGLEEMSIQNLTVEHATAEEFAASLLRRRKPGSFPDVMDMTDRRPYLVDIKLAVQAVSKCMRNGGRVQPEAWREICNRLSMCGEFKTLDTLMSWLMYQYGSAQDPKRRKFVELTRTIKQLSPNHPSAPLQRLLTQDDVRLLVLRGFRTNKTIEAIELLLSWSTRTLIDPQFVARGIAKGLRLMALKPSSTLSDVRQVHDKAKELAALIPPLSVQIEKLERSA